MKPLSLPEQNCAAQLLVCTNERTDGRQCCFHNRGQEIFREFKDRTKSQGIAGTHWVTRTGCLGFCNPVGTTVVIHKKNEPSRWFNEVTDADIDVIWNEFTS